MDFEDDLPCGGYEQQDKKIENNLQALSLQADGKQIKKCNCNCNEKKQCMNCDGSNNCCKKQGQECQNCQCSLKTQQAVVRKPKKKIQCKKCKTNQAVLIHKNQQICKQCLMKNIQYKTRLTLENKIKVSPKSKLLVCFSGGLNSICLVKILSNIKKRYQKSPLFGSLQCIHIQQQSKLPDGYVENFEKITQIKLNVIQIHQIYGKQQHKTFKVAYNLFKNLKRNTNSIDLLTIFRNKLIIQFAKSNKFDFIMSGKNGQSLAAQIFKYFTKGIGGSAPQLSSSESSQFEYPLRQHLQKQLQYYFYEQKLSNLSMLAESDDLSNIANNEIDSFLDQFIATLQDRYSHTAPAIVRTGQKISNNFTNPKSCQWCWLHHDRPGVLCQKCIRLKQLIKDEESWKLMPEWMSV